MHPDQWTIGLMREESDLLTHKYRPKRHDDIICHKQQALELKAWIEDFLEMSGKRELVNGARNKNNAFLEDSCSMTNSPALPSCVLLTGPPGVGKTSMVYAIANQLKMHVVECHASEKRDSKCISKLKLTNQKQHIQQTKVPSSSPLACFLNGTKSTNGNAGKSLSVASASSLILFDDVDVLFKDDGPFWPSLVPFIETSQRPIILTATQSIDKIKGLINNCKIIHLDRPDREQYQKLLIRVCDREGFNRNKFLQHHDSSYKQLIYNFQFDIRQCLNQVHFYSGTKRPNSEADSAHLFVAFHKLDLNLENKHRCLRRANRQLSCLYNSVIISDVLRSHFNLMDRRSMVRSWLRSKPTSFRSEEYNHNNSLGEDIQATILDMSNKLYRDKVLDYDKYRKSQELCDTMKEKITRAYDMFDTSIKSRVESYDPEFKTDVAPFLALIIKSEISRQQANTTAKARRIKRFLHYLDTIEVYLDDKDRLAGIISDYGFESSLLCDIVLDDSTTMESLSRETESTNGDGNKNGGGDDYDDEATHVYTYVLDDSDTEEIPLCSTRKRLKTINDDDTY